MNALVKKLEKKTEEKTQLENKRTQLENKRTQLANERDRLVEGLSLRERVKEIFKKYGWTLQAVVLAAGLVTVAVALAAMNAIKGGLKVVGNGPKAIGKKGGLHSAWPHRLNRWLHLQSGWTGYLLSRRTRLAANTHCGGLLD